MSGGETNSHLLEPRNECIIDDSRLNHLTLAERLRKNYEAEN